MLSWENERDTIRERISRHNTVLKILLKTKNDSFFLKDWIEHHSRIVGIGNIIVFDNNSTNNSVISVYDKFGDDLLVISFKGNHNRVHDTNLFSDLYYSLEKSCLRYLFLDTDEFLIMTDGKIHVADRSLVDYVSKHDQTKALSTTWLYNSVGQADVFCCGPSIDILQDGLTYGKPIISTKNIPQGFANHNCQIDFQYFATNLPNRLFLLHLTRLSVSQRIDANLAKLTARGIYREGDKLDNLMQLDVSDIDDPNVQFYISEIRDRLRDGENFYNATGVSTGCLQLQESGSIIYFSRHERNLFVSFIEDLSATIEVLKKAYAPIVLPIE